MKNCLTVCLVIMCVFFGSAARAADSECDCDCKKGGLGLKIGNFVVGFGARSFKSVPGCDTNIGVGIGIGGDQAQVKLGFGYNTGVIGLGIAFKGAETTYGGGIGFGYDYGDCRMVWPFEE